MFEQQKIRTMKYLWVIAFLFIIEFCVAQTWVGNITLTSQEQVNNFSDTYNNCTNIDGYLIIQGSDITNLQGLSNLNSISGALGVIQCPSLISLAGLSGLNGIGGLTMFGSYNISDISQLQNVTTDLQGLNISNTKLISLNGLQNISNITGDISINSNPYLASIASISHVTVTGSINMNSNPLLNNISFPNITSLTGVSFGTMNNLNSIYMPNLNNVYNLILISNPSLINLQGFSNLQNITSDLIITGNDGLINLSGLENINTIGGNIEIEVNDNLETLEGLGNFNSAAANYLSIEYNPKLTTCNIAPVCNFINSATIVSILGNPGCHSLTSLINTCNNNDYDVMPPVNYDQCYSVISTPISGSGWTNILDNNLDIVCSINPNGNNLGNTDFIVYNASSQRTNSSGNTYMGRDFSIIPTSQPSTSVSIRFYFTASEYQELLNSDPNINSLSDINFTKVSSGCSGSYPGGGEYINQTSSGFYGPFGDVYIETEVTSFSTFFASGTNLVLPVEWSSPLKVEEIEGKNLLTWSVANQVDNDYFEILQSEDNKEYNVVGMVRGDGTKLEEKGFQFLHRNPEEGLNYYKIKQVDFNGKHAFSNISSIQNKEGRGGTDVSFANNTLLVNATKSIKVQLINNLGQLMRQYEVEPGLNQFYMHDLLPGIYFIAEKDNGFIQKIVKH